ncbi:hypothetical protein J6590_095713 [Homalodisca vitripennis]|nr:hypothetical protein J6590_095713 [Homalodisca vitripennis]
MYVPKWRITDSEPLNYRVRSRARGGRTSLSSPGPRSFPAATAVPVPSTSPRATVRRGEGRTRGSLSAFRETLPFPATGGPDCWANFIGEGFPGPILLTVWFMAESCGKSSKAFRALRELINVILKKQRRGIVHFLLDPGDMFSYSVSYYSRLQFLVFH